MFRLGIFIVLSAGLILLSRASLRAPRTHGFFRFFAAECMLVLILLNAGIWFRDPLATHQVISWLLLLVSLFLVMCGAHQLRSAGRPDRERGDDPALVGIEKTTTLVDRGLFKYIRHPLYSSGLIGTWGVFFKDPTWLGALLGLAATGLLIVTAKVEETECIRFFGSAYQTYMGRTKMFVPFLF